MISVIVPVYNLEKYIARALDSILAQTYNNIEIIVVDDGSTDNTAEVVDRYAGDYPEKIRTIHIPNGGVTNARLTGVMQAKGEWIGFVDGDDEIEKDMYEFLLKNAEKYKADISHCGYQMVFEDGRINYFHNTGRIVEQDNLTGLKDLLDGGFVEPGLCNKLFRKTLFQSLLSNESIDTSITINEDLLMNYYLFSEAEKSIFEDICKYHYIVRSSSASRQRINKHKIFDPIAVKEKIIKLASSDMLPITKKAYMSTCINTYNSLSLENISEYRMEKKLVRSCILQRRSWSKLLSYRQKVLAWLIIYMPRCYPILYKVYAKLIMKNPYV